MSRLIAFFIFILTLPIYPALFLLIKFTSPGPFIFTQIRSGKNKKHFTMYKIRTMVKNAEELKTKYEKLNETDGPAFKIRNDPRYTTFGKVLAHTGLDELPQLINIIKGEMAFVGPRPLPISEAQNVPEKYSERFSVLPGLTSPWIIQGSHKLSFKTWMELDCQYVKNKNIKDDFIIILKTIIIILRSILSPLL